MRTVISLICIFIFGVTAASSNDIQQAIKSLNVDNTFQVFNLELSPEELNAFQAITINNTQEYNNFGNLANLQKELRAFLISLGNRDDKVLNKVIPAVERIIMKSIKASGKETGWIALRAFFPTDSYDIPRWHVDGFYYEPRIDQYKFALILKGPGTLFYKLPKNLRKKFDTLLERDDRKALAKLLSNPQLRQQLKINEGSVFIVGEEDSAAVHSEPPIHAKRLFLSILPGSKTQIEEWEKR